MSFSIPDQSFLEMMDYFGCWVINYDISILEELASC